jgi:hypothetical protein
MYLLLLTLSLFHRLATGVSRTSFSGLIRWTRMFGYKLATSFSSWDHSAVDQRKQKFCFIMQIIRRLTNYFTAVLYFWLALTSSHAVKQCFIFLHSLKFGESQCYRIMKSKNRWVLWWSAESKLVCRDCSGQRSPGSRWPAWTRPPCRNSQWRTASLQMEGV